MFQLRMLHKLIPGLEKSNSDKVIKEFLIAQEDEGFLNSDQNDISKAFIKFLNEHYANIGEAYKKFDESIYEMLFGK